MEETIAPDERVNGTGFYCGTVGCIAGHIAINCATAVKPEINAVELKPEYRQYNGGHPWNYSPMSFAADLLQGNSTERSRYDIDTGHAIDRLFCTFRYAGKKLTARNLRDRVKSWLRTGK